MKPSPLIEQQRKIVNTIQDVIIAYLQGLSSAKEDLSAKLALVSEERDLVIEESNKKFDQVKKFHREMSRFVNYRDLDVDGRSFKQGLESPIEEEISDPIRSLDACCDLKEENLRIDANKKACGIILLIALLFIFAGIVAFVIAEALNVTEQLFLYILMFSVAIIFAIYLYNYQYRKHSSKTMGIRTATAKQTAEKAHGMIIAKAEETYTEKVRAIEKAYEQSIRQHEASFALRFESAKATLTDLALRGPQSAQNWNSLQKVDLVAGDFANILRIGDFVPPDREHARTQVADFALPAWLQFPGSTSLVFESGPENKAAAAGAMQSLASRLLAAIPPGKLRFTFVDPIGLGQNVAPFMHLADYDEALVTGKAWSEPGHIETQLAALAEHMENVIQKYLRNQFAAIEEYNAQAGEVAEPYRVLLVFDFPANFTEASARRLVSIAQNGPRCGVYAIVLVDASKPLPYGFNLADLENAATVIAWDGAAWRWRDPDYQDFELILDEPPPSALLDRIIQATGEGAKQASIVQVPFERIAPPRGQWWNAGATTIDSLRVKLGPSGATRVQELELGGKGTAHHALVVGKTGSGKSTLMHTIITNLALTYSPDEVQLYLVDFKKGVEFQDYARHLLPHARVVAIESEREFGLSVLQGLKAEGDRRGKLFTAAGVNTLADYRTKTGAKLPRILLLVDEFQVFFSEDDATAGQSTQLLDELVRQGRSFGIHVLLASQTLAGSYTLPRTTVDQMGVRIALQCSDADSRLILSDDNPAARLLERPGQAIYNNANGRSEGNNPFQVAFLEDERRAALLTELQDFGSAKLGAYPPPIVFEGNAPARIEKNALLAGLLAGKPLDAKSPLIWLGEPIAIRDPLSVAFRKQAGANLLVVGQNEEAAFGLFDAALAALTAQSPTGDAPAIALLDFSQADEANADFYARLVNRLPRPITHGKRRQLPALLDELATEVQRRLDDEAAPRPPRFLLVHGLQRARDLRQDEGLGSFATFDEPPAAANPAQQFATILREGPDVGVHTIVWCDTMTNLNRTLERRTLREFALRVAFQMSAEDSSNLLDTPAASKLGPYRALFYSEDEGRLEKFRPYGPPAGA